MKAFLAKYGVQHKQAAWAISQKQHSRSTFSKKISGLPAGFTRENLITIFGVAIQVAAETRMKTPQATEMDDILDAGGFERLDANEKQSLPGELDSSPAESSLFDAEGGEEFANPLVVLARRLVPPALRGRLEPGLDYLSRDEFTLARKGFRGLLALAKGPEERLRVVLIALVARTYQEGQFFEDAVDSYRVSFDWLSKIPGDDPDPLTAGLGATIEAYWGASLRDLGLHDDALRRVQSALRVARDLQDFGLEASVLGNLGLTYRSMQKLEEALKCFQDAEKLDRKHNLDVGCALALANQAIVLRQLGRPYQDVENLLQKGLDVAVGHGKVRHLSRIAAHLGMFQADAGDFDGGERWLLKALQYAEDGGALKEKAETLRALGDLHCKWGNLGKSEDHFKMALAVEEAARYLRGKSRTLAGKARTLAKMADRHDEAIEAYEGSIAVSHDHTRNRRDEARTLAELGRYERDLGRWPDSVKHLEQSIATWEQMIKEAARERRELAAVLPGLDQAVSSGRHELALRETLANVGVTREHWGKALAAEGDSQLATEQYRAAARTFEAAAELYAAAGDPSEEAHDLYRAGWASRQAHDYERATADLRRAIDLNHRLNRWKDEATTCEELGYTLTQLTLARRAEAEELNNGGRLVEAQRCLVAAIGHEDQAIEQYKRSIAISHQATDFRNEAATLAVLGVRDRELGRWSESVEHLEESAVLWRQMFAEGSPERREVSALVPPIARVASGAADALSLAATLVNLGITHRHWGQVLAEGDFEKAAQYRAAAQTFEEAADLCAAAGKTKEEAHHLYEAGCCWDEAQDFSAAIPDLRKAADLDSSRGDAEGEARALEKLGTMYRFVGRESEARIVLERSEALAGKIGDETLRRKARRGLERLDPRRNPLGGIAGPVGR